MEIRALWDARYAPVNSRNIVDTGATWLERHRDLLEAVSPGWALDLGCGSGNDSRVLLEAGLTVVSADFSKEALRLCQVVAPTALLLEADLRSRLPLRTGVFRLVVAGLSLHYFPWRVTQDIILEVRRCLEGGGVLLVQVNATEELGAVRDESTELEPGFYLVGGEPKRYFDRRGLERLFETGWRTEMVEERRVERYGKTKTLWELVVRKE